MPIKDRTFFVGDVTIIKMSSNTFKKEEIIYELHAYLVYV
jgi:hypothetical protein